MHIVSDWKWGDPPDEFPYSQVINAIETHGRKPPLAYITLCSADAVALSISMLLGTGGPEKYTEKDLAEFIPHDDSLPFRDDAITITTTVLKELDLFDTGEE